MSTRIGTIGGSGHTGVGLQRLPCPRDDREFVFVLDHGKTSGRLSPPLSP